MPNVALPTNTTRRKSRGEVVKDGRPRTVSDGNGLATAADIGFNVPVWDVDLAIARAKAKEASSEPIGSGAFLAKTSTSTRYANWRSLLLPLAELFQIWNCVRGCSNPDLRDGQPLGGGPDRLALEPWRARCAWQRLGGRADLAIMAGGGVPCPEGKPLKAAGLSLRQVATPRLPVLLTGAAVASRNLRGFSYETAKRKGCPRPIHAWRAAC